MDLKNHHNHELLKKHSDSFKKIFFYRICGTGMGAAACLLKERGFLVEGGDSQFYPPMGDYLKQTGIPLHDLKDVDHSFLKSFDLIVVGNVVPKLSDDARMIEDCDVPFCSFPSVLGALVLDELNVVGIAGTHGKTTTTYFFTQVFENLGKNPGYLIGGVMEGRPSSKLGDGSYFFIESDEYDSSYFEKVSKFLFYSLDHLILTSLEFDHADIFNTIEDIKDQFRNLIPKVTSSFIFSKDYPEAMNLRDEYKDDSKEWLEYGMESSFGPKIIRMDEEGSEFKLTFNNKIFTFKTNLIGKHNILNLSSVALFALNEGFKAEDINAAMSSLILVKRRQELRGSYNNSLVIDDFAHHPRAVKETIGAIKIQYPNKNIIVVLEPNSATARSSLFQEEFAQALLEGDEIIMAKPARKTTVKDTSDLDCNKIVNYLKIKNKKAHLVTHLEDLQILLDKLAGKESLFLILSNGTCLGLWESDFVDKLEK